MLNRKASWLPKEPVNWVLSDMVIPAEKSLNVLIQWLREKKAKNFVWTLKFAEMDEFGLIEKARTELRKMKCEFVMRHLANYGKEVCVIGKANK